MINTEEKKKPLNIDELDQSRISHLINDTISEKGGQSMMKSLKALDTTSQDGLVETPRSTSGRYAVHKRFSLPPDTKQIAIEEKEEDFYFEEEPSVDSLKRVLRKKFPLDSTKREFELGQLIIPMSVNRFFEQFIADGAAFGHDIFCSEILHNTEIKTELLVRSDQDDNG